MTVDDEGICSAPLDRVQMVQMAILDCGHGHVVPDELDASELEKGDMVPCLDCTLEHVKRQLLATMAMSTTEGTC